MLQHFGEQLRKVREQKGISLNDFAKKIQVSTGYLSQLERGKSDSIRLEVLSKIQDELQILPLETSTSFSHRLKRIELQLADLEKADPIYTEFLIQNLEHSIEWLKKSKEVK